MVDPMRMWGQAYFGPGKQAVKRLNGPTAMMPQASSAWAFAVGLSNLTLRGLPPWN
jgi:hypothetical protein